jgi:hypothetical protein
MNTQLQQHVVGAFLLGCMATPAKLLIARSGVLNWLPCLYTGLCNIPMDVKMLPAIPVTTMYMLKQ